MVSPDASTLFLDAPWLADLDQASRQAVLNVLVEHRAEAGAVLMERGRPNDHVSFLIDGSVSIERPTPSGERVEAVTVLTAPSVFGLTSFFRPHPPNVTVRAEVPVRYLTLDHHAHGLLRRLDPVAAEQLAQAVVRVLADRFDKLIDHVTQDMARHPEGHPKLTEWAAFRSRLFDETNI